nr:MAG TPA: hypothetical protein [Caudoviricetes sp.]
MNPLCVLVLRDCSFITLLPLLNNRYKSMIFVVSAALQGSVATVQIPSSAPKKEA